MLAESDSAPAPIKRPLCVLALGNFAQQATLEKDFLENGIDTCFVSTDEDLLAHASLSHTFAVFFDLRIMPKAVQYFQESKATRKAYWVALTPRLTQNKTQLFYSMGFSDVLTHPVHPVTFKSRARMLLTRFVKHFSIPEDVTLPPDIVRPPEIEGVSRQGKQVTEPERRVHDLSRDAPEKNPFHLLKGELGEVGEWNQVASQGEIPHPWRAHTANPELSPINTGKFGLRAVEEKRLRYHQKASEKLVRNAKLFQKVDSPDLRRELLAEASGLKSEALLWTPQQSWKHRCQLARVQSMQSFLFDFPKGVSPTIFRESLEQSKSSHFYGSLSLRRLRLFFAQKVKQLVVEPSGFRLVVPQLFYQVQRRQYFRLFFENSRDEVILLHNSKQQKFQAFMQDLSAGGLRVGVDAENFGQCKVGEVISHVEFTIYGKKIKASALVRWKKKAANEKDFNLLGLQFMDIDPVDRDGIVLYVMEEAYGYMKQYVEPSGP